MSEVSEVSEVSDQHVVVDEEEEEVLVFPPLSNASIREAVRLWEHDQAQATEKYNHISKWNTSQVTDMSRLFESYEEFNDNISEWDVSNVTDMSFMFCGAEMFNQDVSKWDVSNVINMSCMFDRAEMFNQNVSEWDVSNVINMSCMFDSTFFFNQDVSKWDVSSVTEMSYMFFSALSFNQDLSMWDVSFPVEENMFWCSKVGETLEKCCGRRSFFDDDCRAMSRSDRQEYFSAAFPWTRRKHFLLFLVSQGYLCLIVNIDCQQEECDVLFDVVDLHREICKFL